MKNIPFVSIENSIECKVGIKQTLQACGFPLHFVHTQTPQMFYSNRVKLFTLFV